MKKIKLLLIIAVTTVFISSCKKEDPTPSCQVTCNNGGTVTANCGCDCPSGFTGTNCQTKILNTINVSVNHDNYYQLYPLRYQGDNEFGGRIAIDGYVRLITGSNNTKIYGVVDADFRELGGSTRAIIDGNLSANRILLYTAPAGKTIYNIVSTNYQPFSWYPLFDYHGIGYEYYNNFVYKIEMVGDTTGDDLPSDGTTGRTRFRIWFDDFTVTIG